MSFEHKTSTRSPIRWILAAFMLFIGVPTTLIFGYGLVYLGYLELLPLAGGIIFSFIGFALIYQIIYPSTYKRKISKEMITCNINEKITYQVKREDVELVYIFDGENYSVRILKKNKEEEILPAIFYMDFKTLQKELMMCNYPVYKEYYS